MDKKNTPWMEPNESTLHTSKKKLSGGLIIGLIAVLLVLVFFIVTTFSQYINQQLFLERQTHLLEITEKIAEIIDVTIDSTWGNVQTCEQLLLEETEFELEILLEDLADMKRFVPREDTVILAFDQMASFYTSEGQIGHWNDPSLFVSAAPDQQVVVTSPPYGNADEVYMVFIQRLGQSFSLNGADRQITHIAIALNIEPLKDTFSVPSFGDSSYNFIVNSDGRRLYQDTSLQEFITGYNILTAMENYEFINGGTIEDLKAVVGKEQQACLEFRYQDTSYYVGTALVPAVNWEIMLFVPTDVLGANTNALLDRTSQYFLLIGAIVLALFCMALLSIARSYSDKQLMRQQEEANVLLSKAAEEAQQASLAKSEFLSRMSHDIRTPINGIMGMTDVAVRHINDQKRTLDCLHKIDTASNHLLSLVNDVLDMSRIESGKVELSHAPFDLRVVLDNCSSIVSGQLLDRQLGFTTQFSDFSHPFLLGDELRLRQIFINILGNSVKFTPDGGSILFAAEEIASTEKQVRFRFVIEDSGRGISEEFLKHLFEPFSQEENQGRSTYKGTGLGMAITKEFIDLMEGSIQVNSQLGAGTRFTIELSFDVNDEPEIVIDHTSRVSALSGMRILLVEDNELNMEIARSLLEDDGILVTAAENGQEAVELFQNNPPGSFDAILMDIMMPVMDGLTAAKAIRSLPRADASQIAIIAMTANAYEEDQKRTQEAGMNAHLTKPVDQSKLFQTLSQYYKKKQETPSIHAAEIEKENL